MTNLQTKIPTDTWVSATWEEYLKIIENPAYEKAKTYYHNRELRIEMSPIGNDHASDHTIIIFAVHLFAGLKGIDLNGKDNCTYRKTGLQEAQPDISYYINENTNAIPWQTTIIDLDIYPPPTLIIEIANTSLADDKGEKRLLYEEIGVSEYWIVDVQKTQIIAFSMENNGSRKITQSQVLPGLEISLLEEALQQTRQTNHGRVSTWLLTQFQQ